MGSTFERVVLFLMTGLSSIDAGITQDVHIIIFMIYMGRLYVMKQQNTATRHMGSMDAVTSAVRIRTFDVLVRAMNMPRSLSFMYVKRPSKPAKIIRHKAVSYTGRLM